MFFFPPLLPPPITRSWRVNTIDVSFILFTVLCFKLFLFVSLVNTRLFHSLHWVAINLFCPHLNSCENVICLTSVEQKCIVVNNKCIAVTNGLDLFYFSFAPSSLEIFLVPFWLLYVDLFLLFVSSRFESARSCVEHVCLLPHCTVLEVQWSMIHFVQLLPLLSVWYKCQAYPQLYSRLHWVRRRFSSQYRYLCFPRWTLRIRSALL